MVMPSATWLYGLFGTRRVMGCKEQQNASPPIGSICVDPRQMMNDKRLDVVLYQPFAIGAERGTYDAMATWGRPMDPYTLQTAPVYAFTGDHKEDGSGRSSPLRVGSVVRGMAADAMRDVRTLWAGRH